VPEAVEETYEEIEETGPASIHELRKKMRLRGTVTKTELFGAFVDVGVGVDGLVHISQLRSERVNRVSEVVNDGDELTMIEPPAVDWDELRAGQVFTGTVKRVEPYGAFVDLGATRDGLVHVSEITTDYIQDPKEYVRVGDEVQVKVLKVDSRRRRIELSMKALEDHLAEAVDEGLEEAPTTMELAWRQAQTEDEADRVASREKKTKPQVDEDDIFARTLRLRSDQE
jgi:small subunit ribosomal protein S1